MILEELNEITNDYFLLEDGKATDIYFQSSFLMQHYMQKQKGLWERPTGGKYIRVPLEYDESEGGAYTRNDPLSTDDREIIDAAYFEWKHYYGNATVYRTDGLMNAGEYAEVQLTTAKVSNAQKTARNHIAKNIYSSGGDSDRHLTGLLTMCSETTTTKYGTIAEDDLVSRNGEKHWEGKTDTTGGVISLDLIRTIRSGAKIHDGMDGKPDTAVTTETLWNKVASILQTQQRFVNDKDTAKAGFQHLIFEGMILAVDDFCPSGHMFQINSHNFGWAVHGKGYFARTAWADLTAGPAGEYMRIYWDGNMICNNRKAHSGASGLTAV